MDHPQAAQITVIPVGRGADGESAPSLPNRLTRERSQSGDQIVEFHPSLNLPGVTVNTLRTNNAPIRKARLQGFDGERWRLFGELLSG